MFASDELKGILEETGYGNHPAVLRLFHQIGKLLGEDNIVGGGRSRQQTAQDFYSQSNMNP